MSILKRTWRWPFVLRLNGCLDSSGQDIHFLFLGWESCGQRTFELFISLSYWMWVFIHGIYKQYRNSLYKNIFYLHRIDSGSGWSNHSTGRCFSEPYFLLSIWGICSSLHLFELTNYAICGSFLLPFLSTSLRSKFSKLSFLIISWLFYYGFFLFPFLLKTSSTLPIGFSLFVKKLSKSRVETWHNSSALF